MLHPLHLCRAGDHWKLRLSSTSLPLSWAQSSDRRLTLQTVRWGEPAINPAPPGIGGIRYTLVDTNGTRVALDRAGHSGQAPTLLELYGLRLMHFHTYFIIVTPMNSFGIAGNVSWRDTNREEESCRSNDMLIDLTAPVQGEELAPLVASQPFDVPFIRMH
jgi:hypothetical protein